MRISLVLAVVSGVIAAAAHAAPPLPEVPVTTCGQIVPPGPSAT